MTAEAAIVRHAKKECARLGLRFHRIHAGPGVEVGWPDAEILGPNRGILFMELKRLGKQLTPIQAVRRDEITALGHLHCKPDNKLDVTVELELFKEICGA